MSSENTGPVMRLAEAAAELCDKSWLFGAHDDPPSASNGLSVVKTHRIERLRAALAALDAIRSTP